MIILAICSIKAVHYKIELASTYKTIDKLENQLYEQTTSVLKWKEQNTILEGKLKLAENRAYEAVRIIDVKVNEILKERVSDDCESSIQYAIEYAGKLSA